MSDNKRVAGDLITQAAKTVLKDRPGVHGSVENSFQMIADLWNVRIAHKRAIHGSDALLNPADVAQFMADLKSCRTSYGDPMNADNFVDGIGYLALAGMLTLPDPDASKSVGDELEKEFPPISGKTVHTNINA
jgi:hypothetical protein